MISHSPRSDVLIHTREASPRFNATLCQTEAGFFESLHTVAARAAQAEPILAPFLTNVILNARTLGDVLSSTLAMRLGAVDANTLVLRDTLLGVLQRTPTVLSAFLYDVDAVLSRDPACQTLLQPVLWFKGVAALQAQRIAHVLWGEQRYDLAFYLQSLAAQVFDVDIHPAATLGQGLLLDHATGVVIGETARVGDQVSILHGVTLGGNGRERGDRHPKVGNHVLISAGAKVLGNVHIGDHARIAASSVVLTDVPPHTTVAGIPARPVAGTAHRDPSGTMEHTFAMEEDAMEEKDA